MSRIVVNGSMSYSKEKLPRSARTYFHSSGRGTDSHSQVELGKPTALRFTGVTNVLSSMFPHILSCSLTSASKQEASHMGDTMQTLLCRCRERVRTDPEQDASMAIESQQDLFVLVSGIIW